MRPVLTGLYKLSGALAAFCIFAIVAIVFAQVCLNLVDKIASVTTGSAIGLTIPSYSDFTGFLLAASSFLGLAYTLREGGHIRVTLVTGLMADRPQRIIETLVVALAVVMAGYGTWYMGLLVYESYEFGDRTSGMVSLPLWAVQVPVLLGLVVLTIAFIDELICALMGLPASYDGKGENLLNE
jgi:TRAP-type C4-dicarboxylate transport system permease small subunit